MGVIEVFEQFVRRMWCKRAAGALVYAKDTKKFLVAMRSDEVLQPNTFGVIGGKIDNENVEITEEVLRELNEETGFEGDIDFTLISTYIKGEFRYRTFLGTIEKEFVPNPTIEFKWENSFFKWVTLEELQQLEPKHFGLTYTLNVATDKIKELTK